MEGSFSNKSLRSRKRRSSSDNSIESRADRSATCSEIWTPLRKSRRLSDNTANLCQKETSEPDEVNATDKTMVSSEENLTLPVENSPSLDLRESTEEVAGEEPTALNESEVTTSTCNVTAASELATAEEMSPEDTATVPMEKPSYLDLRELTEDVDRDDTTVNDASEITPTTGNVTVASELATAEETSSEDAAAVPMEKRSYLDLRELTEGVDRDDTTVIDAGEITPSTGNVTAASELATAEEKSSEDAATVPMEKRSYLDLRELTEGVDRDDTTAIDAGEITPSTGSLTAASELATAEEKSSGINITLPLEKCSALDVHDSCEVSRTPESSNGYEGEITASSHSVITGQDLFIAADEYFEGNITLPLEKVSSLDVLKPAEAFAVDETSITDEGEVTSSTEGFSAASEVLMVGETLSEAYITLPVEKLSLLEVHGPAEVVATGETTNLDEVEFTACAYDGSVIAAEKALSEDTNIPVENLVSLEVHQPTEAVSTEETTNFDDDKTAATTCDGTRTVQEHFQDETTLPAEKISSLEVHEPAKTVATDEASNFDDDKIAATTCDGTPAVQRRSQDKITLPVEKVSSLDVHEPANSVATKETTTSDDSKITINNYVLNATCKHLEILLAQLTACRFHCRGYICIVSYSMASKTEF